MIKFKHTIEEYENEKKIRFNGELFFKNYPVNLQEINKDYLEDAIIRSFQPFLQIQKPIDQDPNFASFELERSDFYGDDIFELEFNIKKPSLKNSDITNYYIDTIEIKLNTESSNVYIEYWTERIFRYASRKRYRDEEEDETFLQNVLNAMARLLNTIIKDYSMMSSSVLRTNTGKFLGTAETRIAEFLGANRNIVKDGQNQLKEPLEAGRSKKIKKYENQK
jgi:hypothetical protein